MPRRFSVRPALTIKGRQFKGLRGWAGKPFHPPLTDIPVAAYVLVAVFDVISRVAGNDSSIGRDFFISGTHVIIAGAIVSLLAALTGFWDWLRSTSPGNQARRTANFHMAVMLTVTAIVIVDIIIRLAQWGDNEATSTLVMILSIVAGGLTILGSTYGGSLAFDYGFNVETSGDHPVWHESEVDVFPGQK
jgi:uncharacterized membrane protein